MQLILESPTKLLIPTNLAGIVEPALKYEQKSITYEYLRWKRVLTQPSHWWFRSHSREELELKVAQLNKDRFKSLLFKDGQGFWTYSGLASKLSSLLNIPVVRKFDLPEFGLVGWDNKPFDPRWYQTKAVDLMAPEDGSRNHGAIQVATGLGKSLIIAMLLKRVGLPAVICVPTLSIGYQLLKDLTHWFGRAKVGQYFDGKKKPDKMFVVAVSASLVRVKEDSGEYQALSKKQVMICDESHLTPAESLCKVSLGLLKNVPFRFFLSGTQLRNDGLDLLLEGIIGDVLMNMSVKDGIEQGFLAPLKFCQWNIRSDNPLDCDDAIKMNRVHLHHNPRVNKHAVKLAKYAVSKGRKVVILIEEIDQFVLLTKEGLLDGLRVAFCHGGGLSEDQKKAIPAIYHKSDALKLVEAYDNGDYDVLVGTSCVQTGTDIKTVTCMISLVGLTSEIQIRQGVIGRCTRKPPGKDDCLIHDYCITGVDKLEKHAKIRRKVFDSTYGTCQVLDAK